MKKAWVVDVNMGYGHQRTAHPLRDIAEGNKVINANSYDGIPKRDRRIWEGTRAFYEFISRFKRIPLVGQLSFLLFNQFQKILSFYPKRDLSEPNFSLKRIYGLFRGGWTKDLINRLKKKKLPLITSFSTPAFAAEFFGYEQDIYCIICDADIARPWAPLNPYATKIKYFAPNERVVERLSLYGVKKENIYLTGYPLPTDNIGTEDMEVLKKDLAFRLLNLDPENKYSAKYKPIITQYLGADAGDGGTSFRASAASQA